MLFVLRQKIRINTISLLVALGLLLAVPAPALASTYGSGGYGSCPYSTGCPASSSGSGGSGSSSSPPSTTPTQILLNDYSEYFTSSGKSLDVSAGQVIYFEVTTGGTPVKYPISIKAIGADFVTFAITSGGADLTLHVGQSQSFDVNGDGQNDIEITLNSINAVLAAMTFRALSGALSPSTRSPIPAASAISKPKGSSRLWLWLSITAIVVALLIWFIIFWVRRRRKKDGHNNWPPNSTIQPGPPPMPPSQPLPPTQNPSNPQGSSDSSPPVFRVS